MKSFYILFFCFVFIIAGCGSSDDTESSIVNQDDTPQSIIITGAGVKGPMANADVKAYLVDYNEAGFRGRLLDSGTTNALTQINGIEISELLTGHVIIEFTVNAETIDITTGTAPLFDSLYTVVSVSAISAGESIYATPLTTMAVDLAIANADKVSPYSGNNDGIVTVLEFESALLVAQLQVKSTLGFGLSKDIDIFSVPPLLTDSTNTTVEQLATTAYRQANEIIAAVTVEIANNSSADDNAQDIFQALSLDLQDGKIDGQREDDALQVLTALDKSITAEISAINFNLLLVPGTETLVSDIQDVLIAETSSLGVEVNTTELSENNFVIEIDEIALISDIDGDGVIDENDAFPLDKNENVDTDADGVGDNADKFPNDPLESVDSDNDLVGDNADVFPNNPSEFADSDLDGVGDNSDEFPNDATETIDSDKDGVGDNRDAYPDDPDKSVLDVLKFSLWLGKEDGLISLPENAYGIEIYSSNDTDCELTNLISCTNGEFTQFLGNDLQSKSAKSSLSSYHHIVTNTDTSKIEVGISRFSKRKNTEVLVFNERIWVIGGYDSQGQNQEVWSSQDGDTWVQITDKAAFGERFDHSVAVFNNKMWLMGGTRYADNAATIRLNDIWSSTDGKNWTLESSEAPFPLRYSPSLLVYKSKLWMMAGTGEDYNGKNDVWFSENGIDWTQATAEAPWEPLTYTNVINFNNQMILIGGGGVYGKVWTSTDGVNWTEEETNYPARNVSSITVHNNKVWLTGGYNSGYLNDVWVSDDGLTFTEVDSSYFFKRAEPGFISFNERLWIIGGRQGSSYGDVMSSQAGENWIRHNFGPQNMRPRYNHVLTHLKGKLLILGGSSFSDDESIWSSSDGLSWEKIVNEAPFDNRSGLKAINFDDKIFLYGGQLKDGINAVHAKNDIWSSDDGINWTEEVKNATFSERLDFGLTQWDGKLWIAGGWTQQSASELNDVWSSVDGINWELETSNAQFPARKSHSLVTINNKLWIIGGQGSSAKYEDVWSSDDGVNWSQETLLTTELFRPRDTGVRQNFKAIAHNNKIFVISGSDSAGVLSDVWSTSDGATWQRESEDTGMHGRNGFSLTIFNDSIWLHGGAYSDGIAYYLKDIWRSTNGADWQVGFHKEVLLTLEE